MPRSDFNHLALGTRLASDLSRARQKLRIRTVQRIGLRQEVPPPPPPPHLDIDGPPQRGGPKGGLFVGVLAKTFPPGVTPDNTAAGVRTCRRRFCARLGRPRECNRGLQIPV